MLDVSSCCLPYLCYCYYSLSTVDNAGATHTCHVPEGTTYILGRTASGRDAVQSAVPDIPCYMEHEVRCNANTFTIVLDVKGLSALVDALAVLPLINWPCWPLFIQQMEGACEEGGRGGGGQMRDRVGEGNKLILQQKTRGTGIKTELIQKAENESGIYNFGYRQ